MERLTTWRSDKRASIANNDGSTPLQQTMKIPKVIDRLAAIEDILGDDYDLDRLRELVEADRDGRCVVLPCKVGAKVYALEDRSYWKDVPCPHENECAVCDTDCHYYRQEMVEETKIVVRVIVSASDMESVMRGIGKTVFLTREAAERALKGK